VQVSDPVRARISRTGRSRRGRCHRRGTPGMMAVVQDPD
jgi:hypothetical protein